jgi:hypothetical protein
MNEDSLKEGFAELDLLAKAEYKESLVELLEDPDAERSAERVGRLVGVLIKQPFAKSEDLAVPSARTAAYRAWNLVDQSDFDKQFRTSIWQCRTLQIMQQETGFQRSSPYAFATYLHYESGFFGGFAQTLRKYICGDKKIRNKVKQALKAVPGIGTAIAGATPETAVGAGGLSLGAYLIHAIPVLGIAAPPVTAAVVVILYTLGVEAFCNWSTSLRVDERQ